MRLLNNFACNICKAFTKNGNYMFYNIYFKKFLNTKRIGKYIKLYNKIDSTNIKAKNLIKNDIPNGSIIIAKDQSGGKGCAGKTWYSEKHGGVYMSIILKADFTSSDLAKVTLLTGLSVCKTIREIFNINAFVKWPNDIIIENKKICGILTEHITFNKDDYLIIGIGINTNCTSFPDIIKDKATSLKLKTKTNISNINIICKVLINFEKDYNEFVLNNLNYSFEEYKKYCASLGKSIKIGDKTESIAIDISKEGFLVVQNKNGKIFHITSSNTIVQGIY